MISFNTYFFLFFSGIGFTIIAMYFKWRFWYIFLLLLLCLIGMQFAMKKLNFLTSNLQNKKFLTFKSSLTYNFRNGEKKTFSISNHTLINDTENKLIIEKVEYSRFKTSNSTENYITTIDPYSSLDLQFDIDYFYIDPPRSISVKGGSSTTRYWIHK
jgi:hypothetical protein